MRIFFLLLSILLLQTIQLFSATYEYELRWQAPNAHTLLVKTTVSPETAGHTDFHLPAWRPGRYYLQGFAAGISHFRASNEKGQTLAWHKIDQDSWRVLHEKATKVVIEYHYYANNQDAGSSFVSADQVYFNPVNLFMYLEGKLEESAHLSVPDLPEDWKIATGLTAGESRTEFTAESYHEFVDCPTVFSSKLRQLQFEVEGVPFFVHFQGDYQGNKQTDEAAIDALKRICQEQAAIFGGFPFDNYHFIFRLLPYRMRHAVEHNNSASFALPANITSSAKRMVGGMSSISSHELWHAWNVKRIRPAALWPYDYSQAQYTTQHWFTEGVTDYYAYLVLVRAGLITEERFLQTLSNTITSLESDYATTVVSPAEVSFDSWLESSAYQHPNHRISYYPMGQRIGLLMDLRLRSQSKGKVSLDEVFRYLYQTYYEQGKGVPEDGIQAALETLSGESWQDFFDRYVAGTAPIDYDEYVAPLGLETNVSNAGSGWDLLGIGRGEMINQGYLVQRVKPGSDAFEAGLGQDDLILEIDGKPVRQIEPESYLESLKMGKTIRLRVLSNFEVTELKLVYEGRLAPQRYELKLQENPKAKAQELYRAWISSQLAD